MDREEEKKRFLDGNEIELGDKQGQSFAKPPSPRPPISRKESPIPPVLSYCASSIMMTVANKYILSFPDFNLNFFLLAVQVCKDSRDNVTKTDILLGYCLCRCNLSMQNGRLDHVSRLQDGRSKEVYAQFFARGILS